MVGFFFLNCIIAHLFNQNSFQNNFKQPIICPENIEFVQYFLFIKLNQVIFCQIFILLGFLKIFIFLYYILYHLYAVFLKYFMRLLINYIMSLSDLFFNTHYNLQVKNNEMLLHSYAFNYKNLLNLIGFSGLSYFNFVNYIYSIICGFSNFLNVNASFYFLTILYIVSFLLVWYSVFFKYLTKFNFFNKIVSKLTRFNNLVMFIFFKKIIF